MLLYYFQRGYSPLLFDLEEGGGFCPGSTTPPFLVTEAGGSGPFLKSRVGVCPPFISFSGEVSALLLLDPEGMFPP